MIKEILIILALIYLISPAMGQTDSINVDNEYREMAELETTGIATGVHIGNFPMVELGYFRHLTFEFPMTFGESYTIESYFINDFVFAPKVNFWMNFLFINAGLSVPWYFDLHGDHSLKIRPEIGFGYKNFKINYSANISIYNRDMENVGKHFLSLNYYIRLKEK